MRIGLFADMYLPHLSGVTNHLTLYKRHFEDLGHEVFLFTFGDLDYPDNEPNVIRTPGLPWGETGWRMSLAFSPRVAEIVPTLDVAHAHHPFQSGRLARPLCRRAGIPFLFTNHTRYDLASDAYARFVPRSLRYGFLRRGLGTFTRGCDLVISPSASIQRWLGEFCDFDGAVVIPNGIDIDRFASPASPVSRASLGFSPDDVVFCYAGRLGPEKSTGWLAEEFARAATHVPNARLLVVGGGPSLEAARDTLRRSDVAHRAVFTGIVPPHRVADFEAAADVFVTGSVSEVHPLVILEALAAGLPVVAVHSPGISDTVTDGFDGLLAPRVSRDALSSRIRRIAEDPALLALLAGNARTTARSYSLDLTADRVLGEYERLIARGKAPGAVAEGLS